MTPHSSDVKIYDENDFTITATRVYGEQPIFDVYFKYENKSKDVYYVVADEAVLTDNEGKKHQIQVKMFDTIFANEHDLQGFMEINLNEQEEQIAMGKNLTVDLQIMRKVPDTEKTLSLELDLPTTAQPQNGLPTSSHVTLP